MTLNQLFLKLTKETFHPSWSYFGRSSKNIYNLPKIMLHITPWTLILMLHIRQSIYLVLTNVLSTSFLMFHITFNEISTTLSIQFWYKGRYTGCMWSNDISILWNWFLLFFIKIENAVHTSCQNSTLLFNNGLIFDIMNTQNNQSLEFEWKPIDLSMIKGSHDFTMFSLCFFKISWILFRNTKEILKEMVARKCSYHRAANISRIENKH